MAVDRVAREDKARTQAEIARGQRASKQLQNEKLELMHRTKFLESELHLIKMPMLPADDDSLS